MSVYRYSLNENLQCFYLREKSMHLLRYRQLFQMNELCWLLLSFLLQYAASQNVETLGSSETKACAENLVASQQAKDRLETPASFKAKENKLERGNIIMPSAATITKEDGQMSVSSVEEDPISAFLSSLVIIDPSPFLPPDYILSRKLLPQKENLIKTKEAAAAGPKLLKKSVKGTDDERGSTKSKEVEKSSFLHTSEGTEEERKAAIGAALSLKTLIGNGKHRHSNMIKSSLADVIPSKVSSDDNSGVKQAGDLSSQKEEEFSIKTKAYVPTSGIGITLQSQRADTTTSLMKSEGTTSSTTGLKTSDAQGVFQPLTSCGHQCLIAGTLAISSGLEWTDALRHPSSLGFKEAETKVTRALTAALWKTQFGFFLDVVEVVAFVPGRIDPVVLVDVLLQFSDFKVQLTAQLLFQALVENLEEGKLPETDIRVDISETYFLMRSTAMISCKDDSLEVPRWAWLALTGGLTSFGIIAVTGCIFALRRFWRSGPRLSK